MATYGEVVQQVARAGEECGVDALELGGEMQFEIDRVLRQGIDLGDQAPDRARVQQV